MVQSPRMPIAFEVIVVSARFGGYIFSTTALITLSALWQSRCLCITMLCVPFFFIQEGTMYRLSPSFVLRSVLRPPLMIYAFLDRVAGPLDLPDATAPLLFADDSSNTSAILSASGIWKSFMAINASLPVFRLGRPCLLVFL